MKRLAKVIRSMQAFGRELSGTSRPVAEAQRVPVIGLALGGGFARGMAHRHSEGPRRRRYPGSHDCGHQCRCADRCRLL